MSTPANRLFTSHDVGRMLQMDPSSIVKWVNDGLLEAFRTPGGHRRITAKALLDFLREHRMYIPPELSGSKRKVLVVDDDLKTARALQRALKAHPDLEVSIAESGIDALVHVGAHKPEALVLDVAMPGMDGLEVLKVLKSSPQTRNIEVVLITGRATPELNKKASALGARAVLSKPFSPADLAALLLPQSAAAAG